MAVLWLVLALALLHAPVSVAAGASADLPAGRWKEIRPAATVPAPDPSWSEEERATWERLRSIGYVGGSIRDARSGVTIAADAATGRHLNFFTSGHAPEALLIDMRGEVLHRWRYAFSDVWPGLRDAEHLGATWWRRAHLFEDGSLLAIFEGLGIIKIDRDSKLIWANPNGAHHDLAVLPSGEIYVLTRTIRRDHPSFQGVLILEDHLSILGPDGLEKRRISLLNALEKSPFRSMMNERKRDRGDIFHTNTVHVLDGRLADREPAFRRGNVLISMNGLGVIAALDLETERVAWARKRPPQGQHDPQILANGHMLFFDNREDAGASVVMELDPLTDRTYWQYRGTPERPFYSKYCGSAQRLANGNTLITESDGGRAFEVEAGGEIVWEFYNPHRAGPDGRFIASISAMLRIDPDYVSDWLDR